MNGQSVNLNWTYQDIPRIEQERTIVFEHPDWVDKRDMVLDNISFQSFYRTVSKIINNVHNYPCNTVQQQFDNEHQNIGVVFILKNINNITIIFLCRPIDTKIQEDININTYQNIADEQELEILTTNARRAYPDYFLADVELWRDIQRGVYEGVDLALSPEEMELLTQLRLPIFITGLAGSGKSTMLIYIFSKYLLKKITEPNNYPEKILFLTYSKSLKDVIIALTKKLVRLNLVVNNRLEQNQNLPDDIERFIEDSFYTFEDFLRKILEEVLVSVDINRTDADVKRIKCLLDTERFVNFSKVREAFNRYRPGELSAEQLWYIVRTYIKGQSINGEINNFNDIPQEERNNLRFNENQFNTALQWWRANFNNCYDMLDLVKECYRWVEREPQRFGNYAVIFCDEAQDFTPVEIQFIIKLSHFVTYGNQNINLNQQNLPFALAGDPSQSLNPTGFDWSKIRRTFYQKLSEAGIPIQQGQMAEETVIARLQMNYRSTPSIAKFSNFIQLARIIIFGAERPPYNELTPQRVFNLALQDERVKFIIITDNNTNQLVRCLQETQVILPCELGEENQYIQRDNILNQNFANHPLSNFYSVYYTKGLEWNAVVLYKWFVNRNVNNLMNNNYANEYFFTKFYVAATRAKQKLYIIDTDQGIQTLNQFIDKLQKNVNNNNFVKWRGALENFGFYEVTDNIPEYIQSVDECLLYAERLFNIAIDNKDIEQFKRAREYFIRAIKIGNLVQDKIKEARQKITLCDAKIAELEGRYNEAANLFLQLRKNEEAFHCLYLAQNWQQIVDLINKNQVFLVDIIPLYYDLANFMLNNDNIDIAKKAIYAIINNKNMKNIIARIISTDIFDNIVTNILRTCEKNEKNLTNDDINIFRKVANILPTHRKNFISLAARLAFRANNFNQAKELWEEVLSNDELSRNPDYYYCCAMVAQDLNERIKNLLDITSISQDYRERIIQTICNEINNNNVQYITNENFERIKQLFDISGRYYDIFRFLLIRGEITRAVEVVDNIENVDIKDIYFNLFNYVAENIQNQNITHQLVNCLQNDERCQEQFISVVQKLTRENKDRNKKFYSLFRRTYQIFNSRQIYTLLKKFSELFDVGELENIDNFDTIFTEWLNNNIGRYDEILNILGVFLNPYEDWQKNSTIGDKFLFKDKIENIIEKNSNVKMEILNIYFDMLFRLQGKYENMNLPDGFIRTLDSRISGLAQALKYLQLNQHLKYIYREYRYQDMISNYIDIEDLRIAFRDNLNILITDWNQRKTLEIDINNETIKVEQELYCRNYREDDGKIEVQVSKVQVELKFQSGNRRIRIKIIV